MLNNNTLLHITLNHGTYECPLSDCINCIPENEDLRIWVKVNEDIDEEDWDTYPHGYSEEIQVLLRDLPKFITAAINFLNYKALNHGADDDYFDNIPGLAEEFKEFIEMLPTILQPHLDAIKADTVYRKHLYQTILVAQKYFNSIIIPLQDENEDLLPYHLFCSCLEPLEEVPMITKEN